MATLVLLDHQIFLYRQIAHGQKKRLALFRPAETNALLLSHAKAPLREEKRDAVPFLEPHEFILTTGKLQLNA